MVPGLFVVCCLNGGIFFLPIGIIAYAKSVFKIPQKEKFVPIRILNPYVMDEEKWKQFKTAIAAPQQEPR